MDSGVVAEGEGGLESAARLSGERSGRQCLPSPSVPAAKSPWQAGVPWDQRTLRAIGSHLFIKTELKAFDDKVKASRTEVLGSRTILEMMTKIDHLKASAHPVIKNLVNTAPQIYRLRMMAHTHAKLLAEMAMSELRRSAEGGRGVPPEAVDRLSIEFMEPCRAHFPDLFGVLEQDLKRYGYQAKVQPTLRSMATTGPKADSTLVAGRVQCIPEMLRKV
jgi:hypothetical protein